MQSLNNQPTEDFMSIVCILIKIVVIQFLQPPKLKLKTLR